MSSASCERWGWACGGIIAIGVIVEFAIAFANPAYGSVLERWGSAFADALIALGVAGEIMFGRLGYSRQRELSRRSDERVAQLEFESGFAQERAAKLEKEAADAKRETERIKRELAWRTIDANSANKLIAELAKISSHVTLVFLSGDPEATEYCAQFFKIFRRANWKVEVVGRTFLGPPVGIFVTHGDKWNSAIQVEIDNLRLAFKNSDFPVQEGGGAVEARSSGFRAATADLKVIIGHRPPAEIG